MPPVLLLVDVVRVHPQRATPTAGVLAGVPIAFDHSSRPVNRRKYHSFEYIIRCGEKLPRRENRLRLVCRPMAVVSQRDLYVPRGTHSAEVFGDARRRTADS